MKHTTSRFPGQFQITQEQNLPMERGRVTESEADQLSPVAILTKAAHRLPLPPLQWSNYNSAPMSVQARNTGFTVMIQASFAGEMPHLSAGPLTEEYKFSQIHFHWGEHDETGSGHSVDGVRYPLEMHVVHVKKDCTSLNEASETKGGIAITVHLFSLKQERNTSLDQLTAVLQFIRKPNCCAKLYPSCLSEIVHPFSNDYFLYWGAVPGSGQQHYRIVWLVSRQMLPVSSQQLHQFRELLDGRGNFIWSNSNNPHPLGDRSLFLVSPSEKSDETMFGVSRRPTRSVMTLESDKSIEIHNAEFKSLVAIEEVEVGSCLICPHPNHANNMIKKPSNHQVKKIKEGESSVEESCVDLGTLQDPTLKTKPNTTEGDQKEQTTNPKIKNCGTTYSVKYVPSQDMYSVILADENEVHLKRKPLIVRKSEPSTEQACVFLTRPPSVHSVRSAPSLSAGGHLGVQKECTDVSDHHKTNNSSEIIVQKQSLESLGVKENDQVNEKTAKIENLTTSRTAKDVVTERTKIVQAYDRKETLNFMISQSNPNPTVSSPVPEKETMVTELKTKDSKLYKDKVFDNGSETEYLLVKQTKPKKSFYKVIGEFLMTPDSKRTFVKCPNNTNEPLLSEIDDKDKYQSMHDESSKNKNIVYKKILLSFPSPPEANKNDFSENNNKESFKNVDRDNSKVRVATNSHPVVNMEVQTSITDNRNTKVNSEDASKKYYVTRITPVVKSQQDNSVRFPEKKLYYAQPLIMKKDVSIGKACESIKNISNTKDGTDYTAQQTARNTQKQQTKNQINEDDVKGHKQSLTQSKNIQVCSDFIDSEYSNLLENNTPSDHLLMKKKVKIIIPSKNVNTLGTVENSTGAKSNINSVSSLDKKTTSQDLRNLLDRGMSVKTLKSEKSQPINEFKENTINQNYVYNMEYASNEHIELSNKEKNSSNIVNNNKKIKFAISIKSHRGSSKSNEFQKLENVTLDKSTVREVDQSLLLPVNGTQIKELPNLKSPSSNDDIVLEEEHQENTTYSSQKSIKKTIKIASPTYKVPCQPPPVVNDQLSSQHLVTVKKIEVPDPYYLARNPRQRLVEYEALPTGPRQQVETIQTEETTTEVKSVKTYTTRKGTRKSEQGPFLPVEAQSTKYETTREGNYDKTETTNLSIDDRFIKQQNTKLNNISGNKNLKLSNYKNTAKVEDKNNNPQKITIDIYRSNNPILNDSSHTKHFVEEIEVKNTRILIGSHQPRNSSPTKVHKATIEPIAVTTTDKNIQSNTLEILIRPNELQKDLHNFRNNAATSYHGRESDNKNVIGKSDNVRDQSTSTMSDENVTLNQTYQSKIKYVDVATSHLAESLPFTSQYLQKRRSQEPSYTGIGEEPTKDPGFDPSDEQGSPHNERQSDTNIISPMDETDKGRNVLPPARSVLKSNKSTYTSEHDDALVYIHHPVSGSTGQSVPTSNLDSNTANETEMERSTKSENVMTNLEKPSEHIKVISENLYQPTKSEELISTHDYESDDVEIDPAQYNVTFKNMTKMELGGQTALVKSLAEVKFKPPNKSGITNKPRTEAGPIKVTKDQMTGMTEDKCCSAIELRSEISNNNLETSADTTLSTEDELKENNKNTNINYSPIRIQTDQATVKMLPPLKFINHWERTVSEDALLENNGKTVRATFITNTQLPTLSGGPLEGEYVFAELHFHWGRKDCCGAEHIINDQRHSMEAHFLYFKGEYRSVKEALVHEDGLAMVAIQLNVGGPPHPLFGQLIKDIALIREAETGVYVPAESLFSWIKQTIEDAAGYFSYKGTMSLEPPYVEAVTWLVFQEPITFCCQQTLEFRKLVSLKGELLLKTYRPPRPLNNRQIIYVPI